MNKVAKVRNGSLDLLRCLCMFFVVIIHLQGHSDYLQALQQDTLTYYLANFIASVTRVAVPVFVLITGYFGISFKLEKVVNMEISLLFYSLLTFGIAIIFLGGVEHTVSSILKTVLPFSYKSWWFATSYIVLMFFAPFINTLLKCLNQKGHLTLIALCFILFNVVSSFSLDPIDTTGGYSYTNFIFLYIIGRYIKTYGLFEKIKAYQWFFLYFGFSVLILLSYRLYGSYKFATYNSILLLLSSISIFTAFTKINIKTTFFSKLAPYTFAVYLISDSFYMRKFVNSQIINFKEMADTPLSLVVMFFYGIAVMACCMLIDFIWKKLFGKIVDKITKFICEIAYKIWNKIMGFFCPKST